MSLKSGTWVRLCSSFLHLKPPISEPFTFSIDCENPLISQGSIIVVPLKQRQRHSAASSAISLIDQNQSINQPLSHFTGVFAVKSVRHRSNFEIRKLVQGTSSATCIGEPSLSLSPPGSITQVLLQTLGWKMHRIEEVRRLSDLKYLGCP
ncbi:hypothetical protein AAC387_Pa01g1359 [Persea americana]